MRLSYEEKRKRVQEFRPIDDTFFEVFANDVDVFYKILIWRLKPYPYRQIIKI